MIERAARLALVLVFFTDPALLAADPPVYVLKVFSNQQGIEQIDRDTGAETLLADFGLQRWQQLQLAAAADRVIAQGPVFYEFEAGTGRFLRRYPALAPGSDTWAFLGPLVDEIDARAAGIEPGFYGNVHCPLGADTPVGCEFPAEAFPGYSTRDNRTDEQVFLRRGLEPGDTSLHVVKLFGPNATGDLLSLRRYPAFDASAGRFWFWLTGTASDGGTVFRRSYAAVADGVVADEIVAREKRFAPGDFDWTFGISVAFAFDPARKSFLHVRQHQNDFAVVAEDADAHETIMRASGNDPGGYTSVAAAPAHDRETYGQLLPVVGEARGAYGTDWRSDAWFYNPAERAVDVTVQRVSGGTALQFSLAPHASKRVTNVLRALGGGPAGDGTPSDAIIIRSPYVRDAQLSVYSRTWTPSPDGGTYGQAVPAVPTEIGYSTHVPATTTTSDFKQTQPAFLLDKRDPSRFRHNIGAVNTSGEPLHLRLRYAILSMNPAPPGDPREVFLEVPPHAMRQFAIETLFPDEVLTSLPPYIAVAGDRPAALWMSMVDNTSGDASFIPFTFFDLGASAGARMALPGVIHGPGANGTRWQTDALGVFSNALAVDANFYGACGDPATRQLHPSLAVADIPGAREAGWGTALPDLGRQVCPSSESASGALEIRTGSWMSMMARTYTTRADGGTYGDVLPLYPPRGWPVRHFAGIEVNDAFRVNVGLYNGTDAPSVVTLKLFRDDGTAAGETHVTLAPRESWQRGLRQLFADVADGVYGLSVVPIAGNGCWPYVSTVDNITGDPTNWW